MKLIQKQGKKFGINFTCQKSKICHQKHNGECGVYCLYFIIYSLNNSFDSINKRIPDVNISNYRNILWRKGNDK
jgi:hypothetical protein